MNIFEKMKLKSMLRNCDYELAGTVIKQQYYDPKRDTELNKLIDDFLADPCFDQAIRLIKYNDMMVFYFTESCTGGLYIRNTSSEAQEFMSKQESAPAAEPVRREPARPRTAAKPYPELVKESQTATTANETTEQEAVSATGSNVQTMSPSRLTEDAVSMDTMSHDTINNRFSFNPSKMSEREEDPERIQSLKESYDWMKEMIKKQKSKPVEEASTSFTPEPASVGEVTPAEPDEPTMEDPVAPAEPITEPPAERGPASHVIEQEDTAEAVHAEQYEEPSIETPAKFVYSDLTVDAVPVTEQETKEFEQFETDAYALHSEAIVKPKKQVEVFYETAPYEPIQNWAKGLDESAIDAALDRRPKEVQEPARPQTSVPTPPRPQKPDFTNVIATIKIDIETMKSQVQEFRRHLRINPWESDEIQMNIRVLEKAIDEFTKAAQYLGGTSKF